MSGPQQRLYYVNLFSTDRKEMFGGISLRSVNNNNVKNNVIRAYEVFCPIRSVVIKSFFHFWSLMPLDILSLFHRVYGLKCQ